MFFHGHIHRHTHSYYCTNKRICVHFVLEDLNVKANATARTTQNKLFTRIFCTEIAIYLHVLIIKISHTTESAFWYLSGPLNRAITTRWRHILPKFHPRHFYLWSPRCETSRRQMAQDTITRVISDSEVVQIFI